MHSELDCPLKPDIELINQAIEEMEKDGNYNMLRLNQIRYSSQKISRLYDELETIKKDIKTRTNPCFFVAYK